MGGEKAVSGRFKCSLKYSRDKLPKSPRKPTVAVRVEWESSEEYDLKWLEQGRPHRKLKEEMSKKSRNTHVPRTYRRKKERHEKNS